MRKHLFYNEKKYVNSITRGESMNLDYILSSYNKAIEYEISEEVSDFMGYIKSEPFYISPSFTDIKTDVKASSLNPKFILFSAPGATGKTAETDGRAPPSTGKNDQKCTGRTAGQVSPVL